VLTVDLGEAPRSTPLGVVIATGDVTAAAAEYWMDTATFTLVEGPCADRRAVSVDSIPAAVDQIGERMARWPQAAAVCDEVRS
jgi:hypothetical protein